MIKRKALKGMMPMRVSGLKNGEAIYEGDQNKNYLTKVVVHSEVEWERILLYNMLKLMTHGWTDSI